MLVEIFEHVSDGVVVLGHDWVYRYVNAAAGRLLGREPRELIGRDYRREYPDALDQPFFAAYARAMATGVPAVFEAHYAPWDRWFENRLYPGPQGLAILFTEVTERRLMERALQQSEQRQGVILAALAVGIWSWDFGADEVTAAPGLAALVGLAGETPDATVRLRGDAWFAAVHPDDVAEVRRRLERLAVEGASYQATFRFRHQDGHYLWVHATGDAVRDADGRVVAAVGAVRDVTAERAALDALRDSEARFRTLAESAPVGIFRRTVARELTYANRRLCEILGRSADDLAPFGWLEAIHPEDRPEVDRRMTAVDEGRDEVFHHAYRILRPDGGVRWVAVHAAPVFGSDGALTGYIGTVDDVTERREAEEALRQGQRLDAVGRLAGGVAHDFNNLLTVIRTHLEFALAELPPESSGAEDLRTVAQAADRAAQLVRQLLAFGRRQALAPRLLDLNAVVQDAARMLRRVLPANLALAVEPAPRPAPVLADATQLEQVLLNLVVNARDAVSARADGGAGAMLGVAVHQCAVTPSPHGGAPTLTCEGVAPPGLATLPPGEYVALVVRDTGIGMDEATRARALDPFFTTKPVGEGTGLGLAMVHGIATQMGGAVALASTPGAGTTVAVYLPRAAADPPVAAPDRGTDRAAAATLPDAAAPSDAPSPAATADARAPEPPRRDGSAPTVLLVEDEAPVRRATARILARHGYRVLEARHGADALLLWRAERAAGRPVAAVLTDLLMPEMGGAELIARLRAEAPDVAVVAMSGYAPDGLGAADPAMPGTVVLAKPFASDVLLRALAAVLHRGGDDAGG